MDFDHDVQMELFGSATQPSSGEDDVVELRKGPWTAEEDSLLVNYVSIHGEGRWNSLARHAGYFFLINSLVRYYLVNLIGFCFLNLDFLNSNKCCRSQTKR